MHHLMPPESVKKGGPVVKIMERSLFSARYCFVENLHSSGLMNEAEFAVYQEWFDFLTGVTGCDGKQVLKENDVENKTAVKKHQEKNSGIKVDLILYLKASPEVCMERIHSRKRQEEKKIPLEYLSNLDRLHDEWLTSDETDPKFVAPVLTIPAEGSQEDMRNIFEQISCFVLGDKSFNDEDQKIITKQGLTQQSERTTDKSCHETPFLATPFEAKENLVLN